MEVTDIEFEKQCLVDEAKIFYKDGKVYRTIYNEHQASLYQKLLVSKDFQNLFEIGLVKSIVCKDIQLASAFLVIEHEKIDFFIDPCEMTNRMFWDCAKVFVTLNLELSKYGLTLKDAHTWNLTFKNGKPKFFDFASIIPSDKVEDHWIKEFYTYFAVPVFLAQSKWPYLSTEYRKQHLTGFGLKLSEEKFIKKLFFSSFFKLKKFQKSPIIFFENLLKWINNKEPKKQSGIWDEYNQSHETDCANPKTIKQQFVYDILKEESPKKVTDLATNKGYFAFMAESLGASVIGFDYEEFCVDYANSITANKRVAFCQMNFTLPTSNRGWGLVIPNSFQRFQSDISLALGLIHHVCLVQKFPVSLFCETCARYAKKGVILEYVFPEDKHIKSWNIKVPKDYDLEFIEKYFKSFFQNMRKSELLDIDGIKRQFLYFFND